MLCVVSSCTLAQIRPCEKSSIQALGLANNMCQDTSCHSLWSRRSYSTFLGVLVQNERQDEIWATGVQDHENVRCTSSQIGIAVFSVLPSLYKSRIKCYKTLRVCLPFSCYPTLCVILQNRFPVSTCSRARVSSQVLHSKYMWFCLLLIGKWCFETVLSTCRWQRVMRARNNDLQTSRSASQSVA
jgi:hypothetical protein